MMQQRAMRALSRTLEEIQYWTLAVRVGKFTPEARPLLTAHAHRTAAAVRALYDALSEAQAQPPYRARSRPNKHRLPRNAVDNPQYLRPLVPDAASTLRAMSTIEHVVHHWCRELPHTDMTPREALALRREVGRTARALEVFAALVETSNTDAVV